MSLIPSLLTSSISWAPFTQLADGSRDARVDLAIADGATGLVLLENMVDGSFAEYEDPLGYTWRPAFGSRVALMLGTGSNGNDCQPFHINR